MKRLRVPTRSSHIPSQQGMTLVEVLMGFLVMALIFLPIFSKLTDAVRDTEPFYTECFAISQSKLVMDTLMFQIPWRCLHAGNPCQIKDPKGSAPINALLARAVPSMFHSEFALTGVPDEYYGSGHITDGKGFRYRVRVKVLDMEDAVFALGGKTFSAKELTEKDADGKWNLLKKIMVEVRWSINKGMDPLLDPNSRKIFLVGIKSDLER